MGGRNGTCFRTLNLPPAPLPQGPLTPPHPPTLGPLLRKGPSFSSSLVTVLSNVNMQDGRTSPLTSPSKGGLRKPRSPLALPTSTGGAFCFPPSEWAPRGGESGTDVTSHSDNSLPMSSGSDPGGRPSDSDRNPVRGYGAGGLHRCSAESRPGKPCGDCGVYSPSPVADVREC